MKMQRILHLAALVAAAATLALTSGMIDSLRAGGPLILRDVGEPLLWPGNPPTVILRFDRGSMGHLTPAQTLAHQQAAAQAWTDIPTSSITLVDGGPAQALRGPEGAGDFAVESILSVLGVNNGGLTPLVIDNEDVDRNGNGDIFDALGFGAGVLGVASPEFTSDGSISEGIVLINGQSMSPGDTDGSQFRGVLVHELGHLLNLAHTVVNGQAVFFNGTDALYPDGTPLGAGLEHVETMYPFIAPIAGGTGVFQAQPHLDDRAILSKLYPQPGASLEQAGSIGGRVLSTLSTPRTGFHVIARNQAGDPLVDAVSAISGDFVQLRNVLNDLTGRYELNLLTPGGRYSLELRDTRGGGFSTQVYRTPDGAGNIAFLLVPAPEEFFSGPDEDNASPPDDPQAPPFLIEVQTGGPDQAVQADILLNEFTVPVNDNCSQAVSVPLSQLPFQDIRRTGGATRETDEINSPCGFFEEGRSVWYRIENDTEEVKAILITTALSDYFNVIHLLDGECSSLEPGTEAACDLTGSPLSGSALSLSIEPGASHFIRVADSDLTLGSGGDLVFNVLELPPAPSNDECGGALEIDSLPFMDVRDVSSAQVEDDEPNLVCIVPVGTASVWYTYTHDQPFTESLLITTAGSNYDTVIQVYEGSCAQLQAGSCDDDGGPGRTSINTFTAVPGVTYLIKVAAFDGVGGNLHLSMDRFPEAPPNDNCAQATPVAVSQLPFLDQTSTLSADNEPNEPSTTCGASRPAEQSGSIWYRLLNDTPLPAEVLLSTEGSEFINVLQIYQGGCSAFLPVQCDAFSGTGITGRTTVTIAPAESIWVKAATFGSRRGGLSLFRAEWLNPVLDGEVQLTLSNLEERRTTAREPLKLGASVLNNSANAVSGVTLQLMLTEAAFPAQASAEDGQCEAGQAPASSFTCRWDTLQPGQQVLVELDTLPRTGGEIDLTSSLDWDQAPGAQAERQVTLSSTVRPFLIFPARLSVDVPTLFDNTFVGLAVVNTTPDSQNLVLQGLDVTGQSLFITDPAAVLEPRGQTALTTEQAGALGQDTLSIAARGQDDLSGFFMVGDLSLQRLDGIGRRLEEGRELVFPVVQEDGFHATQLYLFNPSAEDNPVLELKLFNAEGQELAERTLGFPSNATLLVPVADLFEAPQVDQGFITLHAPHPMKGFSFVASEQSMMAAAAQAPEPAFELFAPHYLIDNQGGNTVLRLYNASHGDLKVRGTIFDEDGLALRIRDFTIGPQKLFVSDLTALFEVDAGPSGLQTGHLIFQFQPTDFVGFFGPLGHVVGSLEFRTGQERTRSLLPLQAFGRELTRFYQVAQSDEIGMFTGLAIYNTDPFTATVTVRAFDSQGRLAEEKVFELDGNRRVLGLLNEEIFFGPGFELVTGHIEVESSDPLVTFALFGDFPGRFLSAIEGQPAN
ncbi:MAG TPA: hypothetical protein VLV83_20050 [Acidobacteriota bacterium]|nr:hypothetical protein [Acidobacteriota bacterium]